MPVTQRICEASDALLMIREGCLVDYIKSWEDPLPQINPVKRVQEIKNGLNCGFGEAFRIYREEQSHQEKRLEIGDKITLVKLNGTWKLYLNYNGIWVRSARSATTLESLCTEECMFQPEKAYSLCTEKEIRKATDIAAFRRLLSHRQLFYGKLHKFGENEIWEYDSNTVYIYGKTPQETVTTVSKLEKHIKEYKAAQKGMYGEF